MKKFGLHLKTFFSMLFMLIAGIMSMYAQPDENEIIRTNIGAEGQKIVLTVTAGDEHNYPMMAAWLEDMEGNHLQTLYVNESVAKGYFRYADKSQGKWQPGEAVRPASLPVWAHSRGVASGEGHFMPTKDNPVPDAYTSATPKADFAIYSRTNEEINDRVKIFFEINQSWDWNEFWTNSMYPGDENYKSSSQPSVVYSAVIDFDVPEEEYILVPLGHGHYSGDDGKIYPDLSTFTTALDIVDEVIVTIQPAGQDQYDKK